MSEAQHAAELAEQLRTLTARYDALADMMGQVMTTYTDLPTHEALQEQVLELGLQLKAANKGIRAIERRQDRLFRQINATRKACDLKEYVR